MPERESPNTNTNTNTNKETIMDITRTAVVTGASSGIGRATALDLGADHRVALVARRADALEALAGELPAARAYVCDLADRTAVAELSAQLADDLGEIDVVVNAAGTRPDRLLTTQPFDEAAARFDEQIEANLVTTFNVTFALAPLIRRPGGRIVNISSIAAQNGGSRAGSAGYAAAKAAVHALGLGLSRELAPEGITVNTIAPGFIAGTRFTGDWADDVVARLVEATPTGRAGHPDDVAAAVRYLTSPAAAMVTAQCLAVNGGTLPTR